MENSRGRAALNPAIPRDLRTIVHKAIEREPGRCYQTAAALAVEHLLVDGGQVPALERLGQEGLHGLGVLRIMDQVVALGRVLLQGAVDGVVNGSGAAARGTGTALRPTQSGKVGLYGALLFGAAALAALILVLVNS